MQLGRSFLKTLALMLAIMGAFRAWFVWDYISPTSPVGDLWKAFAKGLNFDIMVLGYLQIPVSLFLLANAFIQPKGGPQRSACIIRRYYLIGFFLLCFIGVVDHIYYSYFQDHLNVFAFGFLEDHTVGVVDMIWGMFPVIRISFAIALCLWLFHKGLQRTMQEERLPQHWASRLRSFGFAFLVLLCTAAAARGSLGKFPLRARMASVSEDNFINQSILNGPFALKEAIKVRLDEADAKPLLQDSVFQSASEAFSSLLGEAVKVDSLDQALQALGDRSTTYQAHKPSQKPHIVIFLMESLGSQLFLLDSPEFPILGSFRNHLPSGKLFTRALPTTNSTIGTVTTFAAGLPHIPGRPYLSQGSFSRLEVSTAPARFFNKQGYETRFLYGGNTTWRKLNTWLPLQGFQKVEGREDVMAALQLNPSDEAHFKVFDEHLFHYIRTKIEAAKRPQLFLVLSATNHPPFDIPNAIDVVPTPAHLQEQFTGEGIPAGRLRGYHYAIDCLGNWMTEMQQAQLLDSCILAVTGDHNTMDITAYQDHEILAKYGVPIWFRGPSDFLEGLSAPSESIVGHMNIFPTLMTYLNPSHHFPTLEPSIQNLTPDSTAINNGVLLSTQDGVFHIGTFGDRSWRWASPASSFLQPSAAREQDLRALQAKLVSADLILNLNQTP